VTTDKFVPTLAYAVLYYSDAANGTNLHFTLTGKLSSFITDKVTQLLVFVVLVLG